MLRRPTFKNADYSREGAKHANCLNVLTSQPQNVLTSKRPNVLPTCHATFSGTIIAGAITSRDRPCRLPY
jgi:hypothetical protein